AGTAATAAGTTARPRCATATSAATARAGAVAAPAAPTAALAAVTTAEHLHLFGHDLGGPAVLALLVLPLAGLEAALDVDRAALLEVLAGDLAESVEEH